MAILLIFVVVVFGIGGVVSQIWTNFLWYKEVGQTEVFWTPIWARTVLTVVAGVIFFAIFYGSLWLARKLSPRFRPVRAQEGEEVYDLPQRRRWPGRLMLIVSIVLALVVGIAYSSKWQQILLFFNHGTAGYKDPIFHRDAAFFMFTLPMWKLAIDFVGIALLLTFVATVFTYVVDRAMVMSARNRVTLAPHVKAHLSVILAIAMVAKAGDYMIQSWSLAFSKRGVVAGPSYTDVHASLPVLHFLAVVALLAAVIFLANIRYRGWRLPAIAIALMFLTWALAGKAYPAIVQQYRVSPNEITKESTYIANNIEATRVGFGLDKIQSVSYPANADLTVASANANWPTLQNVRLWEPRPALDIYNQNQGLRLYYTFKDVDVDRYTIDGQLREVLISARELDQNQLQPQAKTWVNEHLTYTHGYGAVVSPVNESTSEGPELFIKDIPPVSSTSLKIAKPQIYYGEVGNSFVVVKTTSPEFDYPAGDKNVNSQYQGTGGVPVGSKLRQFAFSFRFATARLFFSSSLTKDSRVMYRRTIEERVQALAPFLQYDKDPYLVIRDDGSLVWMWDAYTTSSRFPNSQPQPNGTNYMRNPIKVVIDAYNGNVTFYQVDTTDVIANAWGKVYPGLFTPGDQMPADLRKHMRYPEDYYTTQAQVLTLYHMSDPQIFYNKEDAWEIPKELYGNGKDEIPVVPYYQMLALPGSDTPEFALLQPFAPLSKKNMTSLMVARQDGANYGKLTLLDLPKDKLVFGPSQVEARISSDPTISAQLTLWDQSGSQVIRGNLLVVPVGDAMMYFEPLYLQASQNPIPNLAEVIVVYSDQVVMAPTLEGALQKIFGAQIGPTTSTTGGTTSTSGGSTTTTIPGGTTTTTVPPTTTTTTPGGPTTSTTLGTTQQALVAQANQHYQAAIAAQKAGDWAEYGRQIDELGKVLAALETLGK